MSELDQTPLPRAQHILVRMVQERLGPVAASSLECLLRGETDKFEGLLPGEIDLIEQYAEACGVLLPSH